MKDLKPLVILRVKDGVAYVSDLKPPYLLPEDGYKEREHNFKNSFVQVANPGILTAWPFGDEVDKAFHHALYKPVDGTYDVSEKQMVFKTEQYCEKLTCHNQSCENCCQEIKVRAIVSLPEKKEVGSDETDFGVLCANLLMFAEVDGTIVNGYRSKEIVQQIRKQLKH